VLEESCHQLRLWQELRVNARSLVISINIGQDQLRRPDLAEHVISVLGANDLDPSRLRLEVAESAVIDDAGGVSSTIESLRAAGVHLTVDDVSAERSSLLRLRDLTIDSLKIDRPLVDELMDCGRTTALVQAITLLAHAWGMAVTAEGVETADQAEALKAIGCDYAQGFHFGRPVAAAEALQFLD
jgi:EAL domain-containing protein (putative c-di-GMP-specific phosphodiesterase class I)